MWKVSATLELATMAQRWSYTLSLTSALDGGVWSRPLCPPGERPGTHCTGGWVARRASLDWCGKSVSTGIWSPDRPASSESLYRLSYPCPRNWCRQCYLSTSYQLKIQFNCKIAVLKWRIIERVPAAHSGIIRSSIICSPQIKEDFWTGSVYLLVWEVWEMHTKF
jgi:hypothetical protein